MATSNNSKCPWFYSKGSEPINPACRLQIIKAVEEYEYIQEGDIMIGGVMTTHLNMLNVTFPWDNSTRLLCTDPSVQSTKFLMDFRFAVEQTNKDPARLPNLTLGYHIYDSCGDPRKAVRSVLQILSGTREPVPNYSCVGKRHIAGFIGDLTSETTVPIAQILTLYGYSQISYGATDPELSDRTTFPYLFRTVPSDESNYSVMSKLLSHFGWTWVGIITSDDISGEREHQILAKYLSREGVCIEFTFRIDMKSSITLQDKDKEIMRKSSTSVIILCGTVTLYLTMTTDVDEKTLILSPSWGSMESILYYNPYLFNCSLALVPGYHYDLDTPEMRGFLENSHPSNYPEDKLLEDIWMIHLNCLSEDQNKNDLYKYIYYYIYTFHNCTGQERITDRDYFRGKYNSPRVHLAVDMMSRALHDMNMELNEKSVRNSQRDIYKHQLRLYLKEVQYRSELGQTFSFHDNGEFITKYLIHSNFMDSRVKVIKYSLGEFSPWAPLDQQLNVTPTSVPWKTMDNKIPRAQCSDNCLPGYRKMPIPGAQSCCYGCAPCAEGEISNKTDSVSCTRCSDMEWPNEKKNQCIGRKEEFLSYTKDLISVFISLVSVLFGLKTQLILGIFIKYRDSPIVRANNRSLSFLLLVSIKLSFLSVFLFLGRPVDITCMLRIITFGITFSIAVSSLLAKTIMVCVAFKATKPGSSWRKWLGVKLSNSVVLFCSSIQIIICMTWLAISPPFQELDIHTSPGTIIIQCNEGSAIGFYSVIGYMGLLAAVSFVLAFLARSLPDSFNEAKYITFSMLLFCSVWITMIPAYLSTKGKNTVCVEIFAILTSSAGLLACIFLPKCYIIQFRSEMNTKCHLLGNRQYRY
ncbi:vomeronasal type-2 receptor 26-like [Xenopus tropicalis]|uniref:Vomeronasal type-2 receptor 26-like n=2 Tax=Xenopus tropicalis TaxID=8364 RepID=A0A8J1J1S8_XENTR|nr:vomeronasal type-2 receptor 26-like [Xenopus tropicalis]